MTLDFFTGQANLWLGFGILSLIALGFVFFPLIRTVKVGHNPKALGFALVTLLALPIAAFYWYDEMGASEQLAEQENLKQAHTMMESLSIEEVIARMERTVESSPMKSKGWYLLGRLYFSTEQYDKALEAFHSARELAPNDIRYISSWVEAAFMANGGKLDVAALADVQNLIKRDPKNIPARNLLAVYYFQQKQYDKAVQLWENLLKDYPGDNDNEAALRASINRAKSLMA